MWEGSYIEEADATCQALAGWDGPEKLGVLADSHGMAFGAVTTVGVAGIPLF